MSETMNRIGVVGAGVMGVGVAQSAAEAGFEVVLVDRADAILESARGEIRDTLRLKALLKRLAQGSDLGAILDRIAFTTDIERLADVDFVVENITEDWSLKQPVYEALDRICRLDCIFAANTSAIEVARIGGATSRPEQVIGMHFMNPVPFKDTVEVIRGRQTSAATIETAEAFLARMGMRAIVVRDSPGFVSNRVLMLTVNEAIKLVDEGVSSAADVDDIFVSCFGHTMGPLATADLIGLDTILNSLLVLQDSMAGDRYAPSPLLLAMVERGQLGKKSGEGFHVYPGGRRVA